MSDHSHDRPAPPGEGGAALARLLARLGGAGLDPATVLTAPDDMAPYASDARGLEQGQPLAVLRPADVAAVSTLVGACAAAGVAIVPQGGNTGLVGGAIARPGQALLNLGRLNRIRQIDTLDHTMTVEAGVILAVAQQAAAAHGLQLPLSLGAEGSCTLGGNLATNAGGILTLRYGNARALVLGLEVVLPDGRVWNGLRRLRKDNTGYDLKHLFIGAEGTLGVITAATLALAPAPARVETALMAVPDPAAAISLLAHLRALSGDALTAFELMPRFAIDGAARHLGEHLDPLAVPAPWYVLVELTAGTPGEALAEMTRAALAAALERGFALDGVLAASGEQRRRLWRLREALPAIGRAVPAALHHDIAVPVSRVPELIARAGDAVARLCPGAQPYPFGHAGDGNIHYNIAAPDGMERADFLAQGPALTRAVHDIVLELEGSISAEHGIGGRKRGELARARDPLEIEMMRRIKAALDPVGLMNPGKVLPD